MDGLRCLEALLGSKVHDIDGWGTGHWPLDMHTKPGNKEQSERFTMQQSRSTVLM
jgi:hypothetical protein